MRPMAQSTICSRISVALMQGGGYFMVRRVFSCQAQCSCRAQSQDGRTDGAHSGAERSSCYAQINRHDANYYGDGFTYLVRNSDDIQRLIALAGLYSHLMARNGLR